MRLLGCQKSAQVRMIVILIKLSAWKILGKKQGIQLRIFIFHIFA